VLDNVCLFLLKEAKSFGKQYIGLWKSSRKGMLMQLILLTFHTCWIHQRVRNFSTPNTNQDQLSVLGYNFCTVNEFVILNARQGNESRFSERGFFGL